MSLRGPSLSSQWRSERRCGRAVECAGGVCIVFTSTARTTAGLYLPGSSLPLSHYGQWRSHPPQPKDRLPLLARGPEKRGPGHYVHKPSGFCSGCYLQGPRVTDPHGPQANIPPAVLKWTFPTRPARRVLLCEPPPQPPAEQGSHGSLARIKHSVCLAPSK